MNMRKIIAVLSAVLMLCAIIPMGAVSVSAEGELLNVDYDNTVALNGTGTTVIEEDGNKILQWDTNHAGWANISKGINVKANTTYNVSLKIKSNMTNSVSVKFLLHDWATVVSTVSVNPSTEWTTQNFQLTSDSNTSVLFMIQTSVNKDSGQIIYLDDIIVTEPATLTEGSNLFVNGDFEKGDLSGWNKHQQTAISTSAAKDGSYGAYLNGNSAGWGGVLDQNVNVVDGKSYIFTFDFMAVRQGLNWKLSGVQSGKTYAGGYESATAWTHIEKSIVIDGDTQLKLNFNCGGQTGTDEMYVDNISLLKVREMSNDGYLTNGTFEMGNYDNWTNLWGNTALEIVEGGYNSDYALKGTASGNWNITYQEIAVEPNTDYIISAWAKNATDSALWIKSAGGAADMGSASFSSNDWAKATVEVNSGSNETLWVGLMGKSAGATYIVDDVLVLKKIPASDDGYIYNGNFESGKKESFVLDQQTAITMDAAKDGNFGAELKGSGWGGLLGYTFAVEAGATYVLSYDAIALVNGFNSAVLSDTWQGEKLATKTFNSTSWTTINLEFVATTNQCYLNLNGYSADGAVHSYVDNVRVVKIKDAHVCEFVGEVTLAPTCTESGVMTYSCTCGEGTYTEEIPASHTYDNDCDSDCNVCEEWREAPHNLTTHVEAVVPANCQEEGYNEHWICEDCGGYFMDNGMGGYYETNPAWMYYYGDCVRPEGAADCAVVPCEVCGNDTYGDGEHDTGVPACQSGTCSKCGDTIEGYGHQNYDGPACLPGNCYYCGEAMEPVAHENGAWAPCQIGECSYGCGLTYPATAEHVDEDADDYCDTCWNHLNHDVVDPCVGGECSICWTYVEGAHTYDNAFDVDCNLCGEVRAVVGPISYIAKSVSEDVNGYAVLFNAAVEGIVVKEGTFVQADFTNATYEGYKLLGLGVKASNGVSETTIEGLRMYDLEDGNAKFAFRIINIPEDKLDVEITMTPYYIVEIDGVATTLYGEAVVGSYAEIAG